MGPWGGVRWGGVEYSPHVWGGVGSGGRFAPRVGWCGVGSKVWPHVWGHCGRDFFSKCEIVSHYVN